MRWRSRSNDSLNYELDWYLELIEPLLSSELCDPVYALGYLPRALELFDECLKYEPIVQTGSGVIDKLTFRKLRQDVVAVRLRKADFDKRVKTVVGKSGRKPDTCLSLIHI